MEKIVQWLFGGKDQTFFVKNAKFINIRNIKSLRSAAFTLTLLQIVLYLAGAVFGIRPDLANIYAVFGILFFILWLLVLKSIKDKKYQRAELFLPIFIILSYSVAILIGTVFDPGGKPIMTIVVSILLPIIFIAPLSKTLSYLLIALTTFTLFDYIAKGDLAYNLFQLSLYTFFGILVGQGKLRDEITAIEEHNQLSTDSLTGIRNSRYLDDLIELIKWNNHICVGIIDIDYFKAYNDIEGHAKGDEVLKRVATTLNEVFSKNEVSLMRRSEAGDEFIFVATGRAAEEIAEVRLLVGGTIAGECLDAIRKLEIILPYKEAHSLHTEEYDIRYGKETLNSPKNEPKPINLSISGGYCLYKARNGGKNFSLSQSKREIEIMLKKADIALSYAKKDGRDRFYGNEEIKDTPEMKDLKELIEKNLSIET